MSGKTKKGFLKRLGPGLITGVSDDDPSGIATYSQAGAQFGLTLLWTMVLTYPLMNASQLISARLGRATGHGIAGCLRMHYPRWILYPIVLLLVVANTINLGADIGAMAGSLQLLIGGSAMAYCGLFAFFSLVLQVFIPYTRYVKYLKWLTLSLFAYVGTLFFVHIPWKEVAIGMLVPRFAYGGDSLKMLVAVFGTTISPYLFFWQASEEAEDVECDPHAKPLRQAPRQAKRELARIEVDTYTGMAFSNIIAIFIMVTTAVTLHVHGITQIETAAQAAEALRPLAGRFCYLLFSLGILGTGLLAVPVLGGSTAYAVGETFKWTVGLEKRPEKALSFYAVLSAATLIGLAMNFIHLDPIRALIWAAVINGVIAVPTLALMVHMASNPKVLGKFTVSRSLKWMGWATALLMAASVLGMFVF